MAFECDECGRDDFRTERGRDQHVARKHPPRREGPITEETRRSLENAKHLTDADAGVASVLVTLAKTIDGMAERDPDAPMDNVTVPTYLKYAESLGLTALSRAKLDLPEERRGSTLGRLRQQRGGHLRPVEGGKGS